MVYNSVSREIPTPVKTDYTSNPVDVPHDFLVSDPYDAKPVTLSQIDFSKTVLPEFAGLYAVVLDNVLSPSECAKLLSLAESSVIDSKKEKGSSWNPALVNIGGGFEILEPDYRNSDRIIWDNQEIVDRLWERLVKVPSIKEQLTSIEPGSSLLPIPRSGKSAVSWDFARLNQRLRFLKYGSGQFFRPHCDGPYAEETNGVPFRTFYTVHLYLNDSKAEVGEEADLVGGATSFLSRDETRKMDVDPRAGRVLIFQHSKLYHSGDDVKAGTKYTVRTDILYSMRREAPGA